MAHTQFDALVIGGGPGGSTAATLLARSGKRVLLLEKEHFPRFHIGESLLPYNRKLFEELGVLPALEAAGFPAKYGAQFHIGNGSKALKLRFQNGRFTRLTTAYQVERARFDDILLKHAQTSGVDVREGWTVNRFWNENDSVRVQARKGDSGEPDTFAGSFLIDASGRGNFTGNSQGLRIIHPKLKKVAIFGHFENVALDSGKERTDTVIVRLEKKWFWIIPLSSSKTSVGCVMDQEELSASKISPADYFERVWKSSPVMRSRMAEAKPTGSIQTTSDFSYYNRRLVGPKLLRVGDAAGFMDPIFSAGVYLAMYSGKLAAGVVLDSLSAGDEGKRLAAYEKKVFRAMKLYWRMVEGFYTLPFLEVFMEPRPKFNLPDAITAILAGELEGGWPMAWRRQFFLLLTRIQRRHPLVPRISF